MKNYKTIIALAAAGLACSAAESKAQLVTGYVWENASSSWETLASPAGTVPAAPPSTALAVGTLSGNSSLNFYSANPAHPDTQPDLYYTISSFLGTGGYTFTGGSHGSDNLNNTLFEFIGTTYLTAGQTYTIQDDDGVILKINGSTVYSSPQPQSDFGNVTLTWGGATGYYSFNLLYAEVDGAPATLDTSLTVVPEPSTVVAGALILLPFGVSTMRILRKSKVS
jgi:hypothetical protein